MHNSDNRVMPPLGVWLLLSILVCFFAVLLFLFEEKMDQKDNLARITYLQNTIKTSTEQPVVLILGTSLTQCALDSADKLEKSIRNKSTINPVILKIWKGAGNTETMSEIVDRVKQFHPDLLVVEANMFFYSPRGPALTDKLLSAFHTLIKMRVNNVYLPEEKPVTGFQNINEPVENFRDGVVDTSQLISFRNMAAHLQQHGTKIILVNIPLVEGEEIKKWNSGDTTIFKSNLKFLRDKVAFKYLKPNKYLDKSYFLDKGHMNQKAFQTYSGWLCDEISRELLNL